VSVHGRVQSSAIRAAAGVGGATRLCETRETERDMAEVRVVQEACRCRIGEVGGSAQA
jgi:hypothetical protein